MLTDGSATNTIRNEGAAVYILNPENQRDLGRSLHEKFYFNFPAQTQAIEAANVIYNSNLDYHLAVFTDAQTTLLTPLVTEKAEIIFLALWIAP